MLGLIEYIKSSIVEFSEPSAMSKVFIFLFTHEKLIKIVFSSVNPKNDIRSESFKNIYFLKSLLVLNDLLRPNKKKKLNL